MTPLPKKQLIQDVVIFEDKKVNKEARKLNKEIKEIIAEDVSYSPELVKAYQDENPTKNAIWRGKYTKQFVKWVENAHSS